MRFTGIVVARAAALLLTCLLVQAKEEELKRSSYFIRDALVPTEEKRKSFIRDKSQAQRRTQEGGFGGIFSNTAFCPQSSSNQYQTVRVWSLLAGLYQLFNPSSLGGTCGTFCEQICNHQPCIRDFEAPDAELCTCFSDAESFCGENTNCDFRTDTCLCQDGYSGDPLIGCIDDDECISNPCGPNGECRNSPGSFSCDCFDGYDWDEPDGGCQDINECDNGDSPCGPNASCDNTVGSFTCECDPNYTGNPPSAFCSDIDECTATENLCGANGQCINVPGSYLCNCNPGYESVAPNGGCINVDECSDNTDSCDDASEVCTDTTGSFLCSCKDGYQGTAPGSCIDYDECQNSSDHNCNDREDCVNEEGSFRCECKDGFFRNLGACFDRDECADNTDNCDDTTEVCRNTEGGFECECAIGYDGSPCENIDECLQDPNPCGPFARCSDTEGSFSCLCIDGYIGDPPSFLCQEINECTLETDTCDDITEVCRNTDGGFECDCFAPGFAGTTPDCEDVDECSDDATICGDNASCENTFGSYECSCDAGFPAGGPPNCRKAVEYEGCPSGTDDDCESGLTCADSSRSDSKPSCCPLTERCKVSQKCCIGFYTNGQECPSGLDVDCRGNLVCGKSLFGLGPLVCCTFAIDDLLSETKTCLL